MPTNNFPNIGYTTYGRDWNFFQKLDVTATTFGGGSVDGYQPDMIITFTTQGVVMMNENATAASKIVEYSFNGKTVHGELDASGNAAKSFTFNNRIVSKMWFRLKAGSTGPITISVQAWGIV